ncbi:hypothetical protein Cch01nite_01680 [Cellulomonas chitinilytica]|uniref:Uncharacterized protein n=1 Tax=Cellulomonas chitinilytica TaxID=398759 RepID=A0A919P0V1_9CELL|nr:hypothetical protein [Cellulomonas chitinilytica]GIG19444.1 hypothetical protein Cch01nite_01680 [Cellulomonas chitinilytica]
MTATLPRLSPRDRFVRERYLLRFSWAMQDYPKNRRIVRELRTELTATAAEVGMTRAVADLGHPRVLAEEYVAELGRRLPRWGTGAVWGALAASTLVWLSWAYAAGTLDTLAAMGGGTVEHTAFGATTTYTYTADTVSVGTVATWRLALVYLVVFLVPYLVGARVWRTWRRPERARDAVPA